MVDDIGWSAREALQLLWVDLYIALAVSATRCQRCHEKGLENGKGTFRWACFERKCGGWGLEGRSRLCWRFSLRCCRCGLRTTPCSVRFFGAKWTPAPLVLRMMAAEDAAVGAWCRCLDVSRKTARRWRGWWDGLLDPASAVGLTVRTQAPAVAAAACTGRDGPLRLWPGRWAHASAQVLLVLQGWTGGRLWRTTRWGREPLPRQKMSLGWVLARLQTG